MSGLLASVVLIACLIGVMGVLTALTVFGINGLYRLEEGHS
jgi:hypothetical protein